MQLLRLLLRLPFQLLSGLSVFSSSWRLKDFSVLFIFRNYNTLISNFSDFINLVTLCNPSTFSDLCPHCLQYPQNKQCLQFLKSIFEYHFSTLCRFWNKIKFLDHSALWLLCFLEIVSFAFKSHCDFMIRHNQIWQESAGALQIKKLALQPRGQYGNYTLYCKYALTFDIENGMQVW